MTDSTYSGPPATGGPYGPPPSYGPPSYAPPQYGPPQYGPPPQYRGPAPWGPAPWGPARGPRRPGQVIAAAVLSFVQAGLVLFATLYLWLLVSLGRLAATTLHGPSGGGPMVAEGTVLAVVQVISVLALLAAGGLTLSRRSRLAWLVVVVASLVQVVLAGYWATRLPAVLGNFDSGASGSGVAVFSVLFAAAPLVALGLVLFRPGRSWFDGTRRR